jgi:hypothetical protein
MYRIVYLCVQNKTVGMMTIKRETYLLLLKKLHELIMIYS